MTANTIYEFPDFELAYNTLIRVYWRHYDEKVLFLTERTTGAYLDRLSKRAVFCTLRDIADNKGFVWEEKSQPKQHREVLEKIAMKLVDRFVGMDCFDVTTSVIRESCLKSLYRSIHTYDSNKIAWLKTEDTFISWAEMNKLGLTKISTCEIPETINLAPGGSDDFQDICYYAVTYAMGRHTYMPSAIQNVIRSNIHLLTAESITRILAYVDENLPASLEDKSFGGDIDAKDWVNFRQYLQRQISDKIDESTSAVKVDNNIYAIGINGESPETIAEDAAKKIAELFDRLMDDQK